MTHFFTSLFQLLVNLLGSYLGIPVIYVFAIILGIIFGIPLGIGFFIFSLYGAAFKVGLDYYHFHWALGSLYFLSYICVIVCPIIRSILKENYKKSWRRNWKRLWKQRVPWEEYISFIAFVILLIANLSMGEEFISHLSYFFGDDGW